MKNRSTIYHTKFSWTFYEKQSYKWQPRTQALSFSRRSAPPAGGSEEESEVNSHSSPLWDTQPFRMEGSGPTQLTHNK